MMRLVVLPLAIIALFGSASSALTADEKPKLAFTEDGKDLVVSTTITVNNSAHVLWTHTTVLGNDVRLSYYVFQNRDLLVRSQKRIEVKWRLVGRKKGEETYHVERSFLPSSAELKELLPQLQKLAEEGEKFRKELKPLKDFTNINLEEFGIKRVEPKKDAKTGFVVGGKNPTTLIKDLTEINGRTIAELEKQMRPGAKGLEGSRAGFLGPEERLLEVLAEDNRYVVDELGLTHQELAKHLHVMARIGLKFNNQEFLYHGRRFKVTGMDIATAGSQFSPFFDGTQASQVARVWNLDNGKGIGYSLLVPR
jgi:hypothetical protein